jgi:hypothetical protein
MKDLKIPKIGEYVRGLGTLLAIEKNEPKPVKPPPEEYIFQEINSQIEILVGEVVVKPGNVFWDFYGDERSQAAGKRDEDHGRWQLRNTSDQDHKPGPQAFDAQGEHIQPGIP